MKSKRSWYNILILFLIFNALLFIKKPFYFRFDTNPQNIVSNYLKSQDIYDPNELIKDRLIISDSDIYLGSGYLYSKGESPVKYNFQHPPLVKYLYGFSLRFFTNPYVIQYIFSFLLISLTYILGYKVSGNYKITLLAGLLLVFDPLTSDSFYNIYLDLGQTIFGLGFILSFIYYPSGWIISGILLGLLMAAKFWSISLFIFLLLVAYRIFLAKNIKILTLAKTIFVAILVYSFTYIVFFFQGGSFFDFINLQFKILKFMLEHNVISSFGQQISLFVTGFYRDWWSGGLIQRSTIWTFFWPMSFVGLVLGLFIKKLRVLMLPIFIIVLGFFVATFKGAPFSRYIIFITPYLYIAYSLFIFYLLGMRKYKNNSVEKHFDKVSKDYDYYKRKNSFYYDHLKKLLKSLIPSNKNVLEFGCGTGDLLNNLKPKIGYGYDISSEMISISKSKFLNSKNLIFSTKFPSTIKHQPFDYIFMSDVIEHLDNLQKTFLELSKLMNKNTKLIITMANPIWEPLLILAEKMKLKMPEGPHKRVIFDDLKIMINVLGMEITKHGYKLLIPIKIPFITHFANKHLEKPLEKLAFIEYFVITKS